MKQHECTALWVVYYSLRRYSLNYVATHRDSIKNLSITQLTGKSKFVRDIIYKVHHHYLNNKTTFNYDVQGFFLEESYTETWAEFLSKELLINNELNINRGRILGEVIDDRLDDTELTIIDYTLKTQFREFDERVNYLDETITPLALDEFLWEYFEKHGTWEKNTGGINGSKNYTPNDDTMRIIIIDTLQLCEQGPRMNEKQTMDAVSRLLRKYSIKCKATVIIIQQIQGDLSTTNRLRDGIKTPTMLDFADSKKPTKDANVIIALFDPTVQEMNELGGYFVNTINELGEILGDVGKPLFRFTSVHLLKSRNSMSNVTFGYITLMAQGLFIILPKPQDMKYTGEFFKNLITTELCRLRKQ